MGRVEEERLKIKFMPNGDKYCFCWCGRLALDGKQRCTIGHDITVQPKRKSKQKRYSGPSEHQHDIGGFQQSGHS